MKKLFLFIAFLFCAQGLHSQVTLGNESMSGAISTVEDSLAALRVDVNTNIDSLVVLRADINTNIDSLVAIREDVNTNTDSIVVHRTDINTNIDSLVAIRDDVNTNIDSLEAIRIDLNNKQDIITINGTANEVDVTDADPVWTFSLPNVLVAPQSVRKDTSYVDVVEIYALGVYATSQNDINSDVGEVLKYDGVDDYSNVPDDANLDMGTDDFSWFARITPDNITDANAFILNKEAGGVGYGIEQRTNDIWIRFDDNTTDATAIIGTDILQAGVTSEIEITFDRPGNATLYQNGESKGTVDISSANLTLSNAGDLRFGTETGAETKPFAGLIDNIRPYNMVKTAAQVKAWAKNTDPAFQGASQVSRVTNGTFATDTDWNKLNGTTIAGDANVIGAGSITANSNFWSLNQTNVFTPYKWYLVTFTASQTVGVGNLQAGAGYATPIFNSQITGSPVTYTITYYASSTQTALAFGGIAGDEFTIDDVIIKQIGELANYASDGITNTTWYDQGVNGLDATNSGVTNYNLPNTKALQNSEPSDADRSGITRFVGQRRQSGGEISAGALIEISHDGTGDDTKGFFAVQIDDGTGLQDALTIDSDIHGVLAGDFSYDLRHSFGFFSDSSETIAVTQNVFTEITNATNTLFIMVDADDVTTVGDTITVIDSGSYWSQYKVQVEANNNDVMKVGLFKNGIKLISFGHKYGVAGSHEVAVDFYLKDLVAGDDLSMRITNTNDSDDPTVTDGSWLFEKKHD